MKFHYVWLAWSSAFLIPWTLLYAAYPRHRIAMRRASAFIAVFGLTEPLGQGGRTEKEGFLLLDRPALESLAQG